MTLKFKRKFLLLVISYLLLVLLAPLFASAASFHYWGPLVSCTGLDCTSLCDLLVTGQNIIYFIMTLAVLAIGPVMIVIGGIWMLISGGSEERFSSGKKMATGAVIGIAITLGAFVILNTFFVLIAVGTGSKVQPWANIQCSAQNPEQLYGPGE